jgi:pilus assembly protein CpaB
LSNSFNICQQESIIMSVRTIIVGILAAICGICATVGVMKLNSGPRPNVKRSIVVAKVDLDMGQKLSANQLDSIDWNSDKIPPGAFSSPAEVIDKYSAASLTAGEVITKGRLTDSPTTLMPAPGMRAFAIEAGSASTSVGRNVVPGNRVDILWQTSGKLNGALDPTSLRLMQNVKILAVGQMDSDLAKQQKSLTLEVRPGMDENLQFAQAFGKLSLALRNPADNEGIEPVESVRLKDILEDLEAKSNQPASPPAWEAFSAMIGDRIAALEQKLRVPSEKTVTADRETLTRIGHGMRAITIQTGSESTGLAGLLEPGDRVDMQLTIDSKNAGISPYPSETLIENIEVLAVDANIYNDDGDGARKMYRSVTLIVMESMIKSIDRAEQLGTLSLTLRGFADSEDVPPRVVMTVDEFIAKHIPAESEEKTSVVSAAPIKIRTLRGPSVQDMPFATQ